MNHYGREFEGQTYRASIVNQMMSKTLILETAEICIDTSEYTIAI